MYDQIIKKKIKNFVPNNEVLQLTSCIAGILVEARSNVTIQFAPYPNLPIFQNLRPMHTNAVAYINSGTYTGSTPPKFKENFFMLLKINNILTFYYINQTTALFVARREKILCVSTLNTIGTQPFLPRVLRNLFRTCQLLCDESVASRLVFVDFPAIRLSASSAILVYRVLTVSGCTPLFLCCISFFFYQKYRQPPSFHCFSRF